MKITFTSCAVFLVLTAPPTKDNNSIQYSGIGIEHSIQQVESSKGYSSVTIGTQVWMQKNLSVNHYRNGDKIPQVQDSAKWSKLKTGAWCWYNNDSATGAVYGRLYNWYAIHDSRGLAPKGWHIPKDSEWTVLTDFLGKNAKNAGGKLKDTGTTRWLDPNVNATNISGFTALGGGYRDNFGQFAYINFLGYWWSNTAKGPYFAFCRRITSYGGFVDRNTYEKGNGFSVRCVKD